MNYDNLKINSELSQQNDSSRRSAWQRKISANIKSTSDERLKIYSPRAEARVNEPCAKAGKDKTKLKQINLLLCC